MKIEAIKALLEHACGKHCIWELMTNTHPPGLKVDPEALLSIAEVLHKNKQLYFDQLSCITGIDNGVSDGTMEVIYQLYSIPFEHSLTLQVVLPRDHPAVPSLTSIWPAADWHEREAYDLLGITFEGHPDLRRILLPSDWEGHPLQKDYAHQERYHGIYVGYDKARGEEKK